MAQLEMNPGARHFNGLSGAGTIQTELYLRTQKVVADCIRFRALGAIVGEAGHGKTFSVDDALRGVTDPVLKTLFSYQATPREVARQLIGAATGVSPGGTRFDLADMCVDVFRDPHVAVIDEAQHLNRDCTFFLRYLLDHPETQATIILVGGNGCWEKVARDPMLRSRVYRRVTFGPIAEEALVEVLPGYHPIYEKADPDLLEEIVTRHGLTTLRTLAIFTHTAWSLCEDAGLSTVDDLMVKQTVRLMGEDDF